MARIAIVGEAWGKDEEALTHPFVGQSGLELARMLGEAGVLRVPIADTYLDREGNQRRKFISPKDMTFFWALQPDVTLHNVLNFRPPENKLEAVMVKAKEAAPGWPPLRQGVYFPPKLIPEVERLYAELAAVRPILILALGNTACWALLRNPKIGAIRGTTAPSTWGKVLPTYHPAAVLRNWSLRTIVVQDFLKATREMAFPEIRRPEREILVNPTLDEIDAWIKAELCQSQPITIAADIETAYGQITDIGFACRPNNGIVIPFLDRSKPGWSYWATEAEEKQAWLYVDRILASPHPKVGQNFLYDMQYLLRRGHHLRNIRHDTMLMHHSLFSELQKGLGFLGSIYTNESSWKLMRGRGEELKRDE